MSWVDNSESLKKSSSEMRENNDCTVRAWCNVFDCDYVAAHTWLKKHGRRNGKGMLREQTKNALKACKKAKIKFGPYDKNRRITVSQFLKSHPTGRYYVASLGHAFCIKDGVVHDYKLGPRRQITMAVRVYLEGEY